MSNSAIEIELDPLSAPSGDTGKPLAVESVLPLLGSVKVRVAVRVGGAQVRVAELLEMKEGGIIVLDRTVDQPLDVLIDDNVVARGVLVAVGENFGLRITETAVTAS